MTKSQTNNSSTKQIIGIAAALFGLAAGTLYQRHEAVAPFNPDDVANTLGLYSLVLSSLLWVTFLVIWLVSRNR